MTPRHGRSRKPRLRERPHPESTLRIIGGDLGGRPIRYLGDPRTRPMKQRVREAVFNLLGPRVAGRHVVDLFAGTGALTWEALSRGADSAVLLEQHFPTARLLRENAQTLGLDQRIHTIAGDTFHWARRLDPASPPGPRDRPWLVFCSPPYEFFVSKRDEMLELIERMIRIAVPRSLIVVESDGRLPVTSLPPGVDWDRREYPPAVVAIGYCTDDM